MPYIKNLVIHNIEKCYTPDYISNVLFEQHIAQVNTVVKMINNKDYYTAIIIVKEWLDTEVAYNFIQRLNNPLVETRIVHKDDNWWRVSFEPQIIILDPLISSINKKYQEINNHCTMNIQSYSEPNWRDTFSHSRQTQQHNNTTTIIR